MKIEENFVKKCFNELVEKYDFLKMINEESRIVIEFKPHKGFQVVGYCLRFLSINNTVAFGGKINGDFGFLRFTEDLDLKNVNFDYLENLILKSRVEIDEFILKKHLNELEQEFKENCNEN